VLRVGHDKLPGCERDREEGRRRGGKKIKKRNKNGGIHIWRGEWRVSRSGGWEGEFGGASKMEVCLEVLLKLEFFAQNL
jgi:hypothetical protein